MNVKKSSHHGILDFWEVQLSNFTGELRCSLPGLEFLVPPYAANEIKQNNKTFKVNPEAVLVFNGNEVHTEAFENSNACLKAVVINPNYISDLCEPLDIKAEDLELSPCEVTQNSQLTQQIQLLAQLSDSALEASAFSVDCFAAEVLMTTLGEHKHSHSAHFEKNKNAGQFPKAMDRIKHVMHENIENPHFNLEQLSRDAGVSKFHLIREFKKSVGTSPAKYLSHIKLDLAKHWLMKTNKSVLSIAMDLGFGDLSTFNKSFKKSLLQSPTEFRMRTR